MTQFIIDTEGSCFDRHGNIVPRLIGPFPTRDMAHDLGISIIRDGSWTVAPLTAPAVAKALVGWVECTARDLALHLSTAALIEAVESRLAGASGDAYDVQPSTHAPSPPNSTEPTDEQVEAAANVLLEDAGPIARVNFRAQYKLTARKVLRAALSVAPSASTDNHRGEAGDGVQATNDPAPLGSEPTKDDREALDAAWREYTLSRNANVNLTTGSGHREFEAGWYAARRSPVPPSAPIDPAPILTYADQCEAADPVNQLAIVLMRAWGEADPRSNVAQHYGSYLATFADMARAALRFAPSAPTPDEAVLKLLDEAATHRYTVGPNMGICAADGVADNALGPVLRAEADLVQRLAAALREENR